MKEVDMSFIPDGESGVWKVSTFTVGSNDFSQMVSLFKTGRGVLAGSYKRLTRNRKVIMSNTPDEIMDFRHFTCQAYGNILINGLGLGCVVKVLLENNEVQKITIIENSEDVIKLIAPYFTDKRVHIIHDDAYNYKPPKGERYNFVWHDIWDNICSDNLPEMTKLHRKYARRADWQDSWAKAICQRQARRDKREFWY